MFFFSLFFLYCYMFMYPCECAVAIAVFVVMATGVSGVLIARVVLWSLEVQPSKVVKDVGETVVTANCLAAVAYAAFQHASV